MNRLKGATPFPHSAGHGITTREGAVLKVGNALRRIISEWNSVRGSLYRLEFQDGGRGMDETTTGAAIITKK